MPALMLAMGILATIYFLVTSMPSDDGRHAKTSAQSEQELAVPADCEKNMCVEVRRDIPRVVTRGDITLHIPIAADTWTATPPKETNLTRVAVCFPGPGNPPPCADGVPAYAFWLREGSLEPSRSESPDERLAKKTETYDGPIEGPADGVSAYLGKTSRIYVLSEKDASGHFVTANCYTECRVRNYVLPGLFADYRFPTAFIGQWPDLDRAIRHYFESVRVANQLAE